MYNEGSFVFLGLNTVCPRLEYNIHTCTCTCIIEGLTTLLDNPKNIMLEIVDIAKKSIKNWAVLSLERTTATLCHATFLQLHY